MKRSWLIGAALVFSLTAVGCDDDSDDDTDNSGDSGVDGGPAKDAGMDATVKPDGGDAGDAGDAS